MSKIDGLKDLVAEAAHEAKIFQIGTCQNPKKLLFKVIRAEHKWTGWVYMRTVIVWGSDDKHPMRRDYIYSRHCVYCKEPQTKKIIE